MKTNRLISIALVTLMALTVVSGAGVITAQKAQANTGDITIQAVSTGTTPTNPVAGDEVTQTFDVQYLSSIDFLADLKGFAITDPNGYLVGYNGGVNLLSHDLDAVTVWTQFASGSLTFPVSWAGTYTITVDFYVYTPGGYEQLSTAIYVTVAPAVTKESVLSDLAKLRSDVNGLPNAAFWPFTKFFLLGAINIATWQVNMGKYDDAARTLAWVLARTDGCYNSGGILPDWNDFVRTCDAQAVLYPQVAGLIADVQVLASDDTQVGGIRVAGATLDGLTGATVVQDIRNVQTTINALNPSEFKNKNSQTALTDKLDAVIKDVDAGHFTSALNKLQNDVIKKTDGYTSSTGAPDKDDLIISQTAQGQVYPELQLLVLEIQALQAAQP